MGPAKAPDARRWPAPGAGSPRLTRDRDSTFTTAFDAVLTARGIEVATTAPQAPRMNAITKKLARTARAECTDRILIAGERHSPVVMAEYIKHHNTARSPEG